MGAMTLTHEQIENLQGRELDAAVAVAILGWTWQRKTRDYFPPRQTAQPRLCALQPPDPDPHGYERVNYFAPHWEVLDYVPGPEERFTSWYLSVVKRNERREPVEWELPHFSDGTDMNATWRVVEAIWWNKDEVLRAFDRWWAGELLTDTAGITLYLSTSAALAICRCRSRYLPLPLSLSAAAALAICRCRSRYLPMPLSLSAAPPCMPSLMLRQD